MGQKPPFQWVHLRSNRAVKFQISFFHFWRRSLNRLHNFVSDCILRIISHIFFQKFSTPLQLGIARQFQSVNLLLKKRNLESRLNNPRFKKIYLLLSIVRLQNRLCRACYVINLPDTVHYKKRCSIYIFCVFKIWCPNKPVSVIIFIVHGVMEIISQLGMFQEKQNIYKIDLV